MSDSPKRQLQAAQLVPKKSWGQNFLTDPQAHRAVIQAAAPPPGATVLELGAGLGALTAELLADPRPRQIIAVERDRDLLPLLRQRFADAGARLQLLEADAARLDLLALAAAHGGPLWVVGNLPYHLAGRIAVELADAAAAVGGAGLLVQREVALRLAAPPGRDRSLLAVLVQRRFAVQCGREVPPGAFYPPPKVRSCVVGLQPLAAAARPDPGCEAAGLWVARRSFAARRKTLLRSLGDACGASGATLTALLQAQGIAPTQRPERLATASFFALGAAMQQAGLLPPATP